jgi:hypothetical protein
MVFNFVDHILFGWPYDVPSSVRVVDAEKVGATVGLSRALLLHEFKESG